MAVKRRKAADLAPAGPLLSFARWFFPLREGMEFIEGAHHRLICATLDRVLRGEISRLIVTLPPGYTKTELAVVNFIAKGFQINPASRFIHATFSDDLARENSDKAKGLIELPEFQELREVCIRSDSRAKDRWKTTAGGGLLAKAAGGPITGFRAGRMDKGAFTGALIIDDPLKPDDAFSPAERQRVNRRATNTFRSRLAHDGVPIVVIMQRLHMEDFAGHLLTGGTGERWDHLDLPALIDRGAEYPREWTHGAPIPHDLPEGPLWEAKHDRAEIEVLKADAYTFASQYAQRPVGAEGALFDMAGFREWSELPPISHCAIYADTAQKTAERNDFSVFQLWARGQAGIFLVDQVRGKWEAPELEAMALAFWAKHRALRPRTFTIEDKSSGTGLIQSLRRRGGIPIRGFERARDKYTRGLDAAPWVASGQVWLPRAAEWLAALRHELQVFDGLGGAHDDQVDPMMDAIADMLTREWTPPEQEAARDPEDYRAAREDESEAESWRTI